MNDDKRYETIGRAISKVTYWIYALKFILTASVIAAVPCLIFELPLWLAPVSGICVFWIYRFIRRMFWRLLFKLIR